MISLTNFIVQAVEDMLLTIGGIKISSNTIDIMEQMSTTTFEVLEKCWKSKVSQYCFNV